MCIVAANPCNWCCALKVGLPGVPLGLLSYRRGFNEQVGVANMFLYPSVVL